MWLYGGYQFFVDPKARASIVSEFRETPCYFTYVMLFALSLLTFMWGVFIRPFGKIRIYYEKWAYIEVWQLAGLVTLAFIAIGLVAAYVQHKSRNPKR